MGLFHALEMHLSIPDIVTLITLSFTAAKKKLFAPADDKSSPAPTVSMRAPPPLGTPQLADPTALLKLNLKHKVQEQMEERVSKMPKT